MHDPFSLVATGLPGGIPAPSITRADLARRAGGAVALDCNGVVAIAPPPPAGPADTLMARPCPDDAMLRLEIKALLAGTSAAEAFETLLDDLLQELKAQAAAFSALREKAQGQVDRSADPEDGGVRLAKADIKAATDAISVIARTLEKIDAMRRTLEEDRARAAEENFDEETYRALVEDIAANIERRAAELADARSGDAETTLLDEGASGAEAAEPPQRGSPPGAGDA